MNAVTAILLSVLVHFGGVELDTTRGASLQWFRDSELAGQWELEAVRAGAYRFVSDEGLVVVERLREANMIYSVHQYETIEASSDGATGPIPRALRSLGSVSLHLQAQNLRASSSGSRRTIDAGRIPVAWSRVDSSTEPAPDESGGETTTTDDSEVASSSAPGGSLTVVPASGQWSVSHPDSGQVMVLRVR